MAYNSLVRLRLYRVESHADTTVDFTEGLNAIVGATDSGKSAIMRSIRLLLFNEMDEDPTTTGENQFFIEGTLQNGTVITRGKRGKSHYYLLTHPGQKPIKFTGFGTKVPPDILEAHGMAPILLDEKTKINLNFSSQLDPPFLLSSSASTRAKVVGHLNGAHIVDASIQEASTRRNKANQDLGDYAIKKAEYDQKLSQLPDVDMVQVQVDSLQDLLTYLRVSSDKLTELTSVFQQLTDIYRSYASTMRLLESEPALQNCSKLLTELTEAISHRETIYNIFELLKQNSTETWKWSLYLEQAPAMELAQDLLLDLTTDLQRYTQLLDVHNRLTTVVDAIGCLQQLVALDKDLARGKALVNELEGDVKAYHSVQEAVTSYNTTQERISKGNAYISGLVERQQLLREQVEAALKALKVCPICGNTALEG